MPPTSAPTWNAPRESDVRQLVAAHGQISDEPLLLAVYYAPLRDQNDIFVFEVIDNFGANSVERDRDLFEFAYSSTADFPLVSDQRLRLVLTNPVELPIAVEQRWPKMIELRDAIADGRAVVVYQDPSHLDLVDLIRG